MAISSINFQKSSAGSFMHNDRTIVPDYLIDDPARNEYSCSASEAAARLQQLYQEAVAAYREHFGQKLQARAYHWEAAVNLNKGHTLADVQRLVAKIEEETGFTCLQIAVHHDEGHINERGVKEYNRHAHVNFFTLDRKTGQQLFRKSMTKAQKAANPLIKPMDRERLSGLQDLTALELGMQRGKKGSKAVRLDHKAFKEAKRREERALAKAKDVVAQYRDERDTLKASGEATQRDYQELKLAYDALKVRAKSKDLTIEELQKQLSEARETSKALKGDLRYSEELLRASRANYERLVKENEELKREVMQLKAELRQRMPMAERQQLRRQISSLEAERNALQGELTEIREVEPTAEIFNAPDPSPSLPKKASAFDQLERMENKRILEELAKDADQKRDQGFDFGAEFGADFSR